MKTKNITIIIIITLLTMGASQPLFSFGSDFLDHMDKLMLLRYFSERDLIDGRIILRFSDKIKLTNQQLSKVESLLLGFEEVSITKNAEIKIKELRLTSLLKSPKTDRKMVEQFLREIGKSQTDLFIAYLNYLFDLREILTPGQIEQLREIKDRYKDHMRERRNSFIERREPGPPPEEREKKI